MSVSDTLKACAFLIDKGIKRLSREHEYIQKQREEFRDAVRQTAKNTKAERREKWLWSEAEVAEVRELKRQGIAYHDIAARIRRSPSSVRYAVRYRMPNAA